MKKVLRRLSSSKAKPVIIAISACVCVASGFGMFCYTWPFAILFVASFLTLCILSDLE